MKFEQTPNGVKYEFYASGPQGATFIIYKEEHHTAHNIQEAKDWLRKEHDVVSIKVEKYEQTTERKNPARNYANLAHVMRAIGQTIKDVLPDHVGFILLTFPYNEERGRANYISSANREDCIKFLRETADRLERNEDNSKIEEL